ncbi:hypothetical protein A5876_002254, partial [Enterococcus sp. 3C8_DIV0646]
ERLVGSEMCIRDSVMALLLPL